MMRAGANSHNTFLDFVCVWGQREATNDRVSDKPNDRTGPQSLTPGSGIGAGGMFTALAVRLR